jgi:uncharacterized protein
MKVFIDTNVWISNFVARGVCYDIVTYCGDEHRILTSEFVLKEVSDKLRIKFKFPHEEIVSVQNTIRTGAVTAKEAPLENLVVRDKDDNHIVAAAVGAGADCILTGDKDLLDLKTVHGIPIIPPGSFMMFEEVHKKKKS